MMKNNGNDTGTKFQDLLILHFNDVYNIEPGETDPVGGAARFATTIASFKPRNPLVFFSGDAFNPSVRETDPVGGAARFATTIASFKPRNPLVFFSGDAFNPSVMSSIMYGEQMVPVLNSFGINAAVYGNHDFDFGVDDLLDFARDSNFPWLMSNVYDNSTKNPLGDGEISVTLERNGHKIGLIGLVEEEWLVTLGAVDPDEVTYLDFNSEGQRLSKKLRDEGCDFIIALTHMRLANDKKLAENVPEIDLILGGHDHFYDVSEVNGTTIIKSDTDFKCCSEIKITFSEDGSSHSIQTTKHDITKDVEEDPEVKALVDKYSDLIDGKMEVVLGNVCAELDGLFEHIRTKETTLGNFIADISRNATSGNIALINSGALRSDRIHPIGEFKNKDLRSILPFNPSAVVVLGITGAQLLTALNNGVSGWPKLEGRFPQISGMEFTFDPNMSPGQRVIESSVKIDGDDLNLEQKYKLATTGYLGDGKDGYEVFSECDILVDEENGPDLRASVRNHFVACKIITGIIKPKSVHRQRITVIKPGQERVQMEKVHCSIAPKIEGRIKIVNQK